MKLCSDEYRSVTMFKYEYFKNFVTYTIKKLETNQISIDGGLVKLVMIYLYQKV